MTVGGSLADQRVRTARLTRKGRKERTELDRRSDDLARSLLEPLPERDRTRLVDAMTEVERLLTAALVEIEVVDPGHRHARHCLERVLRRARSALRHAATTPTWRLPALGPRDAAAGGRLPGRDAAG